MSVVFVIFAVVFVTFITYCVVFMVCRVISMAMSSSQIYSCPRPLRARALLLVSALELILRILDNQSKEA